MVKTLLPSGKLWRKRGYKKGKYAAIYPSPFKSQVIYMSTEIQLATVVNQQYIIQSIWADELVIRNNFYTSVRQMWQKYRVERIVATITMPATANIVPQIDAIFVASDHTDYFQTSAINKDSLLTNPNCRVLSNDLTSQVHFWNFDKNDPSECDFKNIPNGVAGNIDYKLGGVHVFIELATLPLQVAQRGTIRVQYKVRLSGQTGLVF